MNMLRQYKILIWLAATAAFAGCKKLIEINPPVSSVGTEQVFQTKEQANSALAAVYSQMMANTGSMIFSNGGLTVYAGLSADELVNYAGADSETDYQFVTNTLDFTNGTPDGIIWKPAYTFIYGANAVVEGVESSTSTLLDDSSRQVLTGEAKFVRAFCYFYLTNLFGDVPLVLTTDYKKTITMKKTPQADVYAQIVKDLEEAREKLPDDYSTGGGERVRPNKWAAAALLARVRLYQRNWREAEIQATDVINAGPYSLPGNLRDVFLKNSGEAIWQLKQSQNQSPYSATWEGVKFIPYLRISGKSPALLAVYTQPDYFETLVSSFLPPYYFRPQVTDAFEDGDKRRTAWIDSTPTPSVAPYNSIPFYYPNKYTEQKGSASGEIKQYYMVLRLAEQYLIRAEARAQQENISGAAADLDSLRHRAGLPDVGISSKEAMLAAIAHERQTELFAEWGHRWLDLKRTGKAGAVLGAIPSKQPWKPFQLLYPIPPGEISTNPNIKQNPDY